MIPTKENRAPLFSYKRKKRNIIKPKASQLNMMFWNTVIILEVFSRHRSNRLQLVISFHICFSFFIFFILLYLPILTATSPVLLLYSFKRSPSILFAVSSYYLFIYLFINSFLLLRFWLSFSNFVFLLWFLKDGLLRKALLSSITVQ